MQVDADTLLASFENRVDLKTKKKGSCCIFVQ